MKVATIVSCLFRRFSAVCADLLPNADGLDTTNYTCRVERRFGISIGDADAARMNTLRDLCDFIVGQSAARGKSLSHGQVWPEVRRITSHELGVHEDELHEGTRYVEDLLC